MQSPAVHSLVPNPGATTKDTASVAIKYENDCSRLSLLGSMSLTKAKAIAHVAENAPDRDTAIEYRYMFEVNAKVQGGAIVPMVVMSSSFFRPHAGWSESCPRYGLLIKARNPLALSDNETTVMADGPKAACGV